MTLFLVRLLFGALARSDTDCDRDWLLRNVPGAAAPVVLITDSES